MHSFLYTNIDKNRLNNCQASGINALALFTIDLRLHLIDQIRLLGIDLNGEIPARSIRLAQTARPQRTGGAVLDASVVDIIGSKAVALVAGMAGEFFSLRAEIDLFGGIEREVRRGEEAWFGVRWLPSMNAILEALLISKALISFSELDVGDVGIDLLIFAQR
mgnify:CR=1 FL=1